MTAHRPEHLDVVVVGAGLSGIDAAYRLATGCPDRTYTVLEARDRIGGTWDLFRYPGVRSDSDMFTLGYPFRPWRAAKAVADGPSILSYVEETARESGVEPHIRFRTRLERASWSSRDARWTLTLRVTAQDGTAEDHEMTCSFLYLCCGYYDYGRGHAPDLPGLDDFAGRVVHPQFWPQDLDWTGMRVVVIGSGATAITLVPSMAPEAAHVTMLQRSPSYVIAVPGTDRVADAVRRALPARVAHGLVRAKNVTTTGAFYELCRSWPTMAKRLLRKGVVDALGGGPRAQALADEHFTPAYDPWDQRLCMAPDGDFFETLRTGRASVVTDRIDRFVPDGVRLVSGRVLEADLVVTATGLVMLPFGGVRLTVDGEEVDVRERFIYRRMMINGVPNAAAAVGYTNASWTLRADISSRFVCRLLRYLDRHGHDYAVPTPSGTLRPSPAMELTSGYVTRGISRFPSQGHRAPWTFSRRYPLDALTMRTADLRTDMTYGRAAGRARPTPSPDTSRYADAGT